MTRARAGERGFSLIEVLVATALLSVVVLVALMVYDASRKAFAKSENATEQQESVRIAFDKLTTDLRMMGYNVNPDGNVQRPDEQLEGALDHAVILRADFDGSDPTASVTPELALAGGAFSTVSTGNDEIVAYVLSRPDGTGPDTITFSADVKEAARDGVVEPVTIPNVVLTPDTPPYTLYRVTLNNDGSKYGSPAFIVRTPVAENVRNLTFTYYGPSGTFKDPSPTVSEADDAKALRASLTRVKVSLVGMTRQQDFLYNDTTDPAAPKYRKFELAEDVTPRNMRLKGMLDVNADITPPGKPATPALTPGHCGGFIVTWAANPTGDGVTQYRISWALNGGPVAGARNVPGSPYYLDGLTTGSAYNVWIQAQDASGNTSVNSDPGTATVANTNRPSTPTDGEGSFHQKYQIAVTWTGVTTNTANDPSNDPIAPRIRDLAGYRLYSASKPDGEFTLLADESVLVPGFAVPYIDTPLLACQDRYYKLTAVDACGRESVPEAFHGFCEDPLVNPLPPDGVQAHFVSSTGNAAGLIQWNPVTHDLTGHEIKIRTYLVYRSGPIDGSLPPPPPDQNPSATVNDDVKYVDDATPHLNKGQVLYYRIRAKDPCGNTSAHSDPAVLQCAFNGTVVITPPATPQVGVPSVVTIQVNQPSDPSYTLLSVVYASKGGDPSCTDTDNNQSTGLGPWTRNWSPDCAGTYDITATVQSIPAPGNESPCPASATITVTVAAPPPGSP